MDPSPFLHHHPLDEHDMQAQAQIKRRLSSRRSSSSAHDAFGNSNGLRPLSASNSSLTLNTSPADANQPQSATESRSRLTIVRAPQSALADDYPPSRPGSSLGGSRPSTPASIARRSSWGSERNGERGRMSFAFSSFTPINPPSPPPGPAPGQLAGHPGHNRARTHSGSSFARQARVSLTPQQTYDLAISTTATPPITSLPSASSIDLNNFNSNTTSNPLALSPSITALPDSDYLPYLSRPQEVSQLISTPPTSNLFHLLSQTFPSPSPHPSSPIHTLPADPTTWSYPHLLHHLTQVPRSVSPDPEWVRLTRICVRSHSEALWERIKAALGVPPELELEDPGDDPSMAWRVYDFGEGGEEDGEGEALLEPIVVGEGAGTPGGLMSPGGAGGGASPLVGLGYLSPPMSMGMPDIGEQLDEEDEEQETVSDDGASAGGENSRNPSPTPSQRQQQIAGLRITTTSPFSPPLPPPTPSTAVPPTMSMPRSFSTGALGARLMMSPIIPSAGGMGMGGGRASYHPVAERGPGNPLFPSSFSRLSVSPTLSANNPALRSPPSPHPNAYLQSRLSLSHGPAHQTQTQTGRGRWWADGMDQLGPTGEYEYAVTVASGSSDYGGDLRV